MKAKSLSIKNMKEALVNFSGDQKEFDRIYDEFWHMSLLGFISKQTWKKFSDEVASWYIWEDGQRVCVRDANQGDGIIWEYTSDAEYKA